MTVTRSRASFSRVMNWAGGQDTDDRMPVSPEAAEPDAEPADEVPPSSGGR